MQLASRWIASFWLTGVVGLQPLSAQNPSPCRGPDSLSTELVNIAAKYTTATEPEGTEARDARRLPSLAASELVLVTRRSVCQQAAQAYAAQLTVHTNTLSGRVYVVKAGDRYVVYDPEYVYSVPEAPTIMIFDAQFHWLANTTG